MSAFDQRARRGAPVVRPSPIFLGCLAVAVFGGWLSWRGNQPGDRLADFGVFLMVLGAWVVSLCLHEFAHALSAYLGGDRSVEAAGYLTLNPLRYAHPVLSIVIPLLFIVQGGIGLPGGAVYLHRRSLRSPAVQSLVAAAGPAVNVVLAGVLLTLVHSHQHSDHPRLWAGLAFLGFLQLTAALLNLLPVPGLDGWAIIEPHVHPATAHGAEQIKPWGMLGVIVLLQIHSLNTAFFNVIYSIYDRFDAPAAFEPRLADLGHAFFKFWLKVPF